MEYEKFLRNDRNMGFCLENAPLMRFALIQIKEDLHYFVWTFHHIIMDGWSLPLVIEQMLHNYHAIQNRTSVTMKDKKGQYKNYIKWLNDQDVNKAKAYWKEVMQESQDVVAFTQIQSQGENHKKTYRFELELENEIKAFLKKNTLTEYQLFNCAYAIMLSKYFGKEKVIYGVTVSGRNMQIPKINETVGIFINTVPQTVSLQDNVKVKDVLEEIKKQQLERSSYEYLSISDICSTCGRKKLFDSIFVLENYANADSYKNIAEFAITDLKLHEEVNFPLAWVLKHEDGICVESVYNTAYFTDEIMESLLNCYVTIISELLGHYEEQVDTIQLVESTKESVVTDIVDVNGNSLEYRSLQGKKIVITDSKDLPLPNGF
ncbi:condensation domain-containing protein, partial [Faecalibacillus intestinalis]|uniref:condensation domain-containing protein n=1 Tax=Faecalibacillus intestinalis TaxID=1982626 RepID=UPI0039963EB3